MPSESAHMNSAAEARFRVQAPNSLARTIKVIALDAAGEPIIRRLAGGGWKHATFFTVASDREPGRAGDRPGASPDVALSDLAGHRASVADEVGSADLVILIAGPGGHAHAAAPIGQACSLRRVMTTGFVVGATVASQTELSKTMAQLRPWSLMFVVARSDEYIDDMMTALRA